MKDWTCPRCGQVTSGCPALSRFDNLTQVCARCGTDEALLVARGKELSPPDEHQPCERTVPCQVYGQSTWSWSARCLTHGGK